MSKRIQLNVRMDNEQELYEELKIKAEQLNTTVSDLTIAALKHSLGWQISADAIAMLKKINALEFQMKKLQNEVQKIKNQYS